jgi:hypothetical protein
VVIKCVGKIVQYKEGEPTKYEYDFDVPEVSDDEAFNWFKFDIPSYQDGLFEVGEEYVLVPKKVAEK